MSGKEDDTKSQDSGGCDIDLAWPTLIKPAEYTGEIISFAFQTTRSIKK